MSKRHLKSGDPLPPLSDGTLRIYSMYTCPFSERVRLVLAHKNVPSPCSGDLLHNGDVYNMYTKGVWNLGEVLHYCHEVVNIYLKDKPAWFYDKTQAGQTPVLEQYGRFVTDSAICMDYLDEEYPENSLYPKDAFLKAKVKMSKETLGKAVPVFYKLFYGGDEAFTEENLAKLEKELQTFDALINDKFIDGDEITMADFFIWPWIERSCLISTHVGYDIIDERRYPKLYAWRQTMLRIPAVQTTMYSPEQHIRYREIHFKNMHPDAE